MPDTVEIVRFRLKEGTDREEFLRQNRGVDKNFVSQQPGFISRVTAEGEDGEWIVVLHWEKPEHAQASMDKFVGAPESSDFTALIDMDTFTMTRYQAVE